VTPVRPGDAATLRAEHITAGRDSIVNHIVNNYIQQKGALSEEEYRAALDRYLAWLSAANGKVALRGIKRGGQQAIELSLDEVYVPLAAEALPEANEMLKRTLRRGAEAPEMEASRKISMRELLLQGRQLAVIGAPGCGKTTVLQHIAWTLAEALHTGTPGLARDRLGLTGELPLPIYVPLSLFAEHRRRFAGDRDPRQGQLAAFINRRLLERQAGLKLPDDFFAALLDSGQHVILLLDGLDEVPTEEERALVAQAVRDLTYGRKHVRVVATSRTPAYTGRAVLGGDFGIVRVMPLEPEQAADLIRHAYAAIYPADVERDERDRRSASLISSVETLEAERAARLGDSEETRLVTTPLLVRMLLIVHFNLRTLPDQRAELYMEVTDALLTSSHNPDEEVAQRLERLGGDWRARRELCQYAAFQMHSRGVKAGREIGERDLRDLLCGYLTERRHKSAEDATALVDDFIAVNRQRGGLMEEIAGRHRFSHLSFQEFLVGRYLAEVEREVERIAAYLSDPTRAGDSWWREPGLLTIGYLNVTAQDAATGLVRRLARLDDERPSYAAAELASAELASTAFLEWGGADALRADLAGRLAELLSDPGLTGAAPLIRAWAGRALARLGDPRAGVGVKDGLPDIRWSAPIPAGPFPMGNSKQTDPEAYDDEAPRHMEEIREPFRISIYPITNEQFDAFVQDGGYTGKRWQRCWTAAGREWKGDRSGPNRAGGIFDLPNHPVANITWYEAVAFCNWLSEKTKQKVTLPTEAQWERAARSTDGRRYPWNGDITPEHANYGGNVGTTTAVGIYPLGIAACGALDMSGNVWEWCLTQWRENYNAPPDDNIDGQATRVWRGGAYGLNAWDARCAVRLRNLPYDRDVNLGFRVALSP
jgi:formylglycine-generating enzyme required for sulfatase activity